MTSIKISYHRQQDISILNEYRLNSFQQSIVIMRKIIHLLASSTIFGSVAYSYIYFRTKKNLEQYNKILESGNTKDASRLSNDSFGISWGFQADDIVMNKIDSGDYLFIKFECHECLSPKQYGLCMLQNMFNLDEQFDTLGYAYRNAEGLFIIFNQFGLTRTITYPELVSLPYLKGLVIQKSAKKQISYHKRLKEIMENEQQKHVQRKETVLEMVNRINKSLYGQEFENVLNLRQLQDSSQQTLVRTQTNRTLRSL